MKKILIILVLAILLVIAGCEKKDKEEVKKGPYEGGTNGLEISFVEAKPPSEFDQDESVPVDMIIKNKGEYAIPSGKTQIMLYGLDLASFSLSEGYKTVQGDLRGVSEFMKEGGEQRLSFGSLRYKESIVNSEEFTLRAKVCYDYETKVSTDVCMGSTILEEVGGEQICSIGGEKLTKNDVSSAPVQITSIKEELKSSDRLWFDIKIENKGKGDVYYVSESCSNLDREDEDVIKIEVYPSDIVCAFKEGNSNKGTIDLENNKYTLTCKKTVTATGSNYEQKFSMKLDYKYIDRAEKTIKIFEAE